MKRGAGLLVHGCRYWGDALGCELHYLLMCCRELLHNGYFAGSRPLVDLAVLDVSHVVLLVSICEGCFHVCFHSS